MCYRQQAIQRMIELVCELSAHEASELALHLSTPRRRLRSARLLLAYLKLTPADQRELLARLRRVGLRVR